MGFRYSLAQVRIEIGRGTDNPISFGGNKSMLGSITLSRSQERFSVEGDATGGYVINETLDPTGEVTISIRQFAELSNTLTNIFNSYDDDNAYGALSPNQGAINITVFYRDKIVGTANGCFLNMPEYAFEEEAGDRDFTFVAGEVLYEVIKDAGQIT
jgi:hypothetical protein